MDRPMDGNIKEGVHGTRSALHAPGRAGRPKGERGIVKREMILPFAVLAAVPFIMVLGNSMLIPVFPTIERELSLSTFQAGLLITAFSLPAGAVIPFAGALSDRIGRKRVMAPALVLYGLGGLIAGFAALAAAKPYAWILAGRIVQGVGAGGTYQIALALTGDLFTSAERTKAVGILEAANGFGKVVSPILGSLFALIIWFAPFFAYGVLAIPAAFAVWRLVKEPKAEGRSRPLAAYLRSFSASFGKKSAPLLSCYFAGMVGLFLLFGLLSFLSDDLEQRHRIAGFTKGFLLAIPVGTMALTAYLAGLFAQKKMDWFLPLIAGGLGLAALATAFIPAGQRPAAMLALASVIGVGIGLILPAINTLVTSATGTEERGLVTALYGTVRFFGVAMGPPAFGLVRGGPKLAIFLGGAGIAAVAGAFALMFIRPDRLIGEGPGLQKSMPDGAQAVGEKHGEGGAAPAGTPAGRHVRRNPREAPPDQGP